MAPYYVDAKSTLICQLDSILLSKSRRRCHGEDLSPERAVDPARSTKNSSGPGWTGDQRMADDQR
jgi:hypothetical protein